MKPRSKKIKDDVKLSVDSGHTIAKSKSTSIVSSGHDEVEARNMLKEAVDIFLEFTRPNVHKKRETLKVFSAQIKHKNTTQHSLISCDMVEYHFNHLFFYNKEQLAFKVWLKKDYKNIKEALKDVGITVNIKQ